MKQNVLITLRGTQACPDGKPERVELVTHGTMTGRNGKYAISYEETELTGTPGVTSTFLVFNPRRVVLTREGAIKSRMVFVKDTRDENLYDLGFGALLIGITTKDVQVDLDEEGGRLFIDYTVDVEQEQTTHNTYELIIAPVSADA